MPHKGIVKAHEKHRVERALNVRRPLKGERKRGRDGALAAIQNSTEAPESLAVQTRNVTDAEAAPQFDGTVQAPESTSSPSTTPAGRESLLDQHSASSSLASSRTSNETDMNGLVHSTAGSRLTSGGAAGDTDDEETSAWFLQQSRGAAQAIQAQMESSVCRFKLMETRLESLLKSRQELKPKLEELARSHDHEQYMEVVSLNVGGEHFMVPSSTLLGKDSPNYFHSLLGSEEAGWASPIFKDENGSIFIDRDPACFKYVVDYLRGYHYFNLLKEDALRRLKVDAVYYQLPGLMAMLGEVDRDAEMLFSPGPGVSPERNRLRVVYGVAIVGDVALVTGRHTITFEVKVADYVGFGLISESCVNTDLEFHRIPDCCVYYMSGVFYANYPYHRKEENLERIENGDFISMKLDLDKGYVEYILKNSRKMVSLGRARRLRFATTMKLASRARIVPPEEVKRRLPAAHYTFDE